MPHKKLSYTLRDRIPAMRRNTDQDGPNFSYEATYNHPIDKRRTLYSSNYQTSQDCSIEYHPSKPRGQFMHKKIKLTKREKECLEWASEGKTSFEIATILGLSENTINNYVASVVRKMGASNRLHMVGIALREKYID